MKFKKFSTKELASTSMDAGGLILGGMVSSGIEGMVPIDDSKTRKIILAGAGILGSTMIGGNDTTSKIIRNLLLGMGIRQGTRFIQEAATPSLPEADGTEMNKFVHDMFETGGGTTIVSAPQKRMGMGYRFTPKQPQSLPNFSPRQTQTSAVPNMFELPLT